MVIGAAWRIRLNRLCAEAMRPSVKLLWPLVMLNNDNQQNMHQNALFTAKNFFKKFSDEMSPSNGKETSHVTHFKFGTDEARNFKFGVPIKHGKNYSITHDGLSRGSMLK